ncbi:hypothetical protein LCGC14_2907380 [marine sediment metagenome]|uniref:SH3b domain-containing protein n=1 Tax=marine sediment metagenome TaxID=412755 RepID=A0A0F8XSL7_9ZZZZ
MSTATAINPTELETGKAYHVSRETPLMLADPVDPSIEDIEKVDYIPKGGVFTVLESFTLRNKIWYRAVWNSREGWINSIALLGQHLAEKKKKKKR